MLRLSGPRSALITSCEYTYLYLSMPLQGSRSSGYNARMKVRVTMEVADRKIDEVVTGVNADDILAQAKSRVERELGWKGFFLKAFTPLAFGQEAVRRYNAATDSRYAIPETCDEFLHLGVDLGYFTILADET